MAKLVAVLPVQPVQSVQCVQDLLLRHPGATQPLQQIDLLDGEARLLAEVRHPADGQREKAGEKEDRDRKYRQKLRKLRGGRCGSKDKLKRN